MKLLIDIGNTRIKWAFCQEQLFLAHGEAAYRGEAADAVLRDLVAQPHVPQEIRIANVGGADVARAVGARLDAAYGIPLRWARPLRAVQQLRNGYHDPAQLGVDRWLGICAAWRGVGRGVCVVAAGTAITIDLVRADGAHLGGLIVPGLRMMIASLRQGTGDLDRLAGRLSPLPSGPPSVGRDTGSAMLHGAVRAAVALLMDCYSDLVRSDVGSEAATDLVLTGGDAPALMAALPKLITPDFRPNLVLEGLSLDPPCFATDA